ncbi:MAG: glycosyltransferase family 4 protein [Verrucomicrobia bacterium]|nr:glycosyltransferase family 4 protein [Verrucomicrobiota bacterium]
MRVIHVITRLIVGGAQENTIASVLGLLARPGFDVTLVTGPSPPGEGTLARSLADCPDRLSVLKPLIRPPHPLRDLQALRQLTCLFTRVRPDLVHTHSGKAGVLGRWAAHRARVPVIVHTIHGPSFGPFQGSLSNTVFRAAERFAGRFTTHFVSVAEAMTRQYLAAGIGRPEQYTRIASGFPLEPFLQTWNDPALRQELGLAPNDIVIGKIARFCALKGHDELFEAAPGLVRECPRLKFLLVGDGPRRPRFEALAVRLGLADRFRFTGLVAPEQVPALVGVMDLLVHLSRREGLPRVLPQALCAARPVVACDCDGAGEVCLDGQTGFLVRPGDRSQLVQQVLRLARDPALREGMGRRGQVFVRQHFAVEKMLDELAALYVRLAA